jgi:hypothetical protein
MIWSGLLVWKKSFSAKQLVGRKRVGNAVKGNNKVENGGDGIFLKGRERWKKGGPDQQPAHFSSPTLTNEMWLVMFWVPSYNVANNFLIALWLVESIVRSPNPLYLAIDTLSFPSTLFFHFESYAQKQVC